MKADYRGLGKFLRRLREERDIAEKQVAADLRCNERSLRRWEAGGTFSDRGRLLGLLIQALKINDIRIINRALKLAGFVNLTSDEIGQYALETATGQHKSDNALSHKPQKTQWGPTVGKRPGIICYEGDERVDFVPWSTLKTEVESVLLNQLGVHIPVNCKVVLDAYRGRKDWLVRIIDLHEKQLGYVWFGTDADNDWGWDGLVRVGDDTYVVWQVFQRYSDGSYARIKMQKPRAATSA